MKVKDLLEELRRGQMEYGKKFLDWDIYSEQLSAEDKQYKSDRKWKIIEDSEEWEYFKCEGFNTKFPKEKIITINVNY